MKKKLILKCTLMVILLISQIGRTQTMGTAFNYQGQLTDGDSHANGYYDFEFRIFDSLTGGAQLDGVVFKDDVDVRDGRFTVPLDFGTGIFDGDARWLEIWVRPGASFDPGAYIHLSPRQKLNPTPYALYALNGPGSTGFWSANGNHIYNTNTGNVGLGTDNPNQKLHLYDLTASVNVNAESPASYAFFMADGGNNSGLMIKESGVKKAHFYWNTANQSISISDRYDDLLVIKGGNVGVGTTTPSAKMEVDVGSRNARLGGYEGALFPVPYSIWSGVKGAYGSNVQGYLGRRYNGAFGDYYYAVHGTATTSGRNFGVFGEASGGSANWGGYFVGNVYASSKLAIGHVNPVAELDIKSNTTNSDVIRVIASDDSELFNISETGTGDVTMSLRDSDGNWKIRLSTFNYSLFNAGNVGIGMSGVPTSRLQVVGKTTTTELEATSFITTPDLLVDGRTTTDELVITGGSDLAEPFEITDDQPLTPGSLVVIDEQNPGALKLSQKAYDHQVAGIVSGAGGINPGLILSQTGITDQGVNIALTGRVYALADCTNGPIKPGDILTTSDTPGHAMKATDRQRSYGAVIGKAMSSLDSGSGLVLVLVNLQ